MLFQMVRSPVSSKAYLQFDANSDYYKETVYQTDYKHLEFEDDPNLPQFCYLKQQVQLIHLLSLAQYRIVK